MRRKASITVFAALSLMLVAQLLFTLLEAARHYELQKVLYMNTDTVLESVFADYCSPLWETYKILGVRVDDTEGKLCFNNREAQLRPYIGSSWKQRTKNFAFRDESVDRGDDRCKV